MGFNDRSRFLSLALCGETGELANFIKKEWRDNKDYTSEIVKELADIGNYLYMLAEVYKIDLEKEMLAKLLEVEQRPAWKLHR